MNTEPVTRAIVLRLYLNRAQRSALRRWQGGLRRAWNGLLSSRVWCDAGKSVADAGMGEFLRQIAYKADWRQREVTEADRWYPSSRRCSACGEIHDMPLSKRWMSCACGNEMNRDENASRNLYAYPEERGNAGDILPKTRRERGVQELAAVPSPVPLNELRILKRGSEKRACVMYRFTEVNNSEDVDAA